MRLTRNGFLTSVLVVAALFVGSFVTNLFPDPEAALDQPFVREAPLGTPVELRTGTVTLTGVRTAPSVTAYGQTATTTETWLVADVSWTARDEPNPLSLGEMRWEASDGRLFALSAVTASCGSGQPGLTVTCQVPFEVTKDALPGGHLLVPAKAGLGNPDSVARIDAGLDEARATELLASTATITLAEPVERGRP